MITSSRSDSLQFFRNLPPIQQNEDGCICNIEISTIKQHLQEICNDFEKINNLEEIKNLAQEITYLFLKKFLVAAFKNPLESDIDSKEKCLKLACKIAHFSSHNLNSNPGYIVQEDALIERQIELLYEDNPETTNIICGLGTYGSDWKHVLNFAEWSSTEKKIHVYLVDPYNINFVFNPYHLFNENKDWTLEVDTKIKEILHFSKGNISITSIPSKFPFNSSSELSSDKENAALQSKIQKILQSHLNAGCNIAFGCYFIQDGKSLKEYDSIALKNLNVIDLYLLDQAIPWQIVNYYRKKIEEVESFFQLLTENDKKINLSALISLIKKADWSDSQFPLPYREDLDLHVDYFKSFWNSSCRSSFHFLPLEDQKAAFLKYFVIHPSDETKTFYLLKKFLSEIRSNGIKCLELRTKIRNSPCFKYLSQCETNSFLYKIYEEIKTKIENEDSIEEKLKPYELLKPIRIII